MISTDEFEIIIPSDETNFSGNAITSGIYVGSAGSLAVVRKDNVVVIFPNIPANTVLPIGIKRVNATGTTATNLVALF